MANAIVMVTTLYIISTALCKKWICIALLVCLWGGLVWLCSIHKITKLLLNQIISTHLQCVLPKYIKDFMLLFVTQRNILNFKTLC